MGSLRFFGRAAIVASGLFLFCQTSMAAIPNGKTDIYWNDTHLDLNLVASTLSEEGCYSSAQTLWACIRFVNQLGGYAEPQMQVFPAGTPIRFKIKSILQTVGTLQFAEGRRVEPPPSDNLKLFYRQRALYNKARFEWAGRVLAQKEKVDFLSIARRIIAHLPAGLSRRHILGLALNQALHAIDAHAMVIPTALQDIRFTTADQRTLERADSRNLEVKTWPAIHGKTGLSLYLRIHTFSDATLCDHLIRAIRSTMDKAEIRQVILDLRGNGGGLIDQAVCVAGVFVGRKLITEVKGLRNGRFDDEIEKKMSRQDRLTAAPMVILVDGRSASASEIVAGALQDYERAWVVGQRTFGKGSVQTWNPLKDDATLTLGATTGRFYQPSGRSNQRRGIIPDFKVPSSQFVPREADLYFSALSAEPPSWSEPRPERVQAVAHCMKRKNPARNRDRVLQTALDVLACDR